MDNLNYKVLPLKDMAIRRTIAVLLIEPDILGLVKNFDYKSVDPWNDSMRIWQETVEDKMSDKISNLQLPASLSKLLIDTVKPMGRQIPGWKNFHEEYLNTRYSFDELILGKLCWTAKGALDYRKTAEELILSDVVDVQKRYKLASLYCLEDDIRMLWKELPEQDKMYFYDEKRHFESRQLRQQFWWPYIIRGEQHKLGFLTVPYRSGGISFYQFAFQYSAEMPNKAAAEYFFQKLTQEEKDASLITTAKVLLSFRNCHHGTFPKETVSDTFRYLLSLMTPEQQMQIFQLETYSVLKCFVDWPLLGEFSDIANLIWNFLPERYYEGLLWDLFESLANFGCYFQPIFQEFFLHSPRDVMKRFVDPESIHGSYFGDILDFQDKEALETTFRCVDAATRAGLVLSEYTFKHFHSSISISRWDVVEVCLREARLSKADKERLKESFMGYLRSIGLREMELKTPKWMRFFQFLDETTTPSKRCSEDDAPTEAKVKKLNCEKQE